MWPGWAVPREIASPRVGCSYAPPNTCRQGAAWRRRAAGISGPPRNAQLGAQEGAAVGGKLPRRRGHPPAAEETTEPGPKVEGGRGTFPTLHEIYEYAWFSWTKVTWIFVSAGPAKQPANPLLQLRGRPENAMTSPAAVVRRAPTPRPPRCSLWSAAHPCSMQPQVLTLPSLYCTHDGDIVPNEASSVLSSRGPPTGAARAWGGTCPFRAFRLARLGGGAQEARSARVKPRCKLSPAA